MPARLLGPNDEPQKSGTIVAVNYGDYRRQCDLTYDEPEGANQ